MFVAADRPETGSDALPLLVSEVPGPRSRELATRLAAVESPVFEERRKARDRPAGGDGVPIVLARGQHANVFDVDGNRYLDFAAGFGTAVLGHGPSPAHTAAADQIGLLVQGLGDLYGTEQKLELLERLAALYPEPGARVMLGQSGADAVTIAMKTAVLTSGRQGVLAFEGAYHGLSYAPLAACGFASSFRKPFLGQLGDFVRFAPYPKNESELGRALEVAEQALAGGEIGAVLVEPLLGRGGGIVAPPAFFGELGKLTHRQGALLIADEIWTGMGRTGTLLASAEWTTRPDLICVGKGLGGSFPISACIGSQDAMAGWARGGSVMHTSTHAGAPLGCAAALATLGELVRAELPARARDVGLGLAEALRSELHGRERVVEVRGQGLLLAVELAGAGSAVRAHHALLRRGYLSTVGGQAAEVVVLTPPLVIDEQAAASIAGALADSLGELG